MLCNQQNKKYSPKRRYVILIHLMRSTFFEIYYNSEIINTKINQFNYFL